MSSTKGDTQAPGDPMPGLEVPVLQPGTPCVTPALWSPPLFLGSQPSQLCPLPLSCLPCKGADCASCMPISPPRLTGHQPSRRPPTGALSIHSSLYNLAQLEPDSLCMTVSLVYSSLSPRIRRNRGIFPLYSCFRIVEYTSSPGMQGWRVRTCTPPSLTLPPERGILAYLRIEPGSSHLG